MGYHKNGYITVIIAIQTTTGRRKSMKKFLKQLFILAVVLFAIGGAKNVSADEGSSFYLYHRPELCCGDYQKIRGDVKHIYTFDNPQKLKYTLYCNEAFSDVLSVEYRSATSVYVTVHYKEFLKWQEEGRYSYLLFWTTLSDGRSSATYINLRKVVEKGNIILAKKGQEFTLKGITYKVTDVLKGTVTATKLKTSTLSTVKIPEQIKYANRFWDVTEIAPSFCRNNKAVKKVVLGLSVEKIGDNAFRGCVNLTSVTSGYLLKYIGKNAFYGDKKLKSIALQSRELSNSGVGTNAFKNIYTKCVFKVSKGMENSYKKIFVKKGANSKIRVIAA